MWILPNNHPLQSAFAPACEVSSEELKELSDLFERSALWRSKASSSKTWLMRWKRVHWLRRLYGRTVRPFPAHLFRDRIDWIFGGYPCTPFSLAGLRKGEDDPRHLWPFIREHVKAIEPLGCFFENVDDHLTLGFETVYRDLRDLGYSVEAGIFTAEEVGAPHERQRLFILAVHNANIKRFKQEYSIRSGRQSAWHESEEFSESIKMDDATVPRCESKRTDREQGPEKYSGHIEASSMGNSDDQRLQGRHSGFCEECTCEWTSRSNGPFDREVRWPVGPSETQHEWEYPRIITRQAESNVGLSVDGFRFREDFLRALGNACVPDTAEKAFRTLLTKFTGGA